MNYLNMRYRLLSRRYSYIRQEFSYHWLQSGITYEYKEEGEYARKTQRIISRDSGQSDDWIAVVSNNNQRWKKPETYKDQ